MSINKNSELLPFYKKAKDRIYYNPETGVFTWKQYRSSNAKKGDLAGTINNTGYRAIRVTVEGKQKHLYTHRLAWFITHGELPNIIDHINHNRDDNRIENLRSVNNSENLRNSKMRVNNKSGYRGVYFLKSINKWESQITLNGKKTHLGHFSCPKEASRTYEQRAKELFGEFYNKTKPLK